MTTWIGHVVQALQQSYITKCKNINIQKMKYSELCNDPFLNLVIGMLCSELSELLHVQQSAEAAALPG